MPNIIKVCEISDLLKKWNRNQRLNIVIAKTTLFTKVNAEPINSFGAERAIIAEYWGESPTTTIPQKIRNVRNIVVDVENIRGEIKQQQPDNASWTNATFALPIFFEITPPTMQPTLPEAMIINDQKGIFNFTGFSFR